MSRPLQNQSLAVPDRQAMAARLRNEIFDVLIIGAGINGAGAAREAAARGLKVAVIDRGDIACGTSSRSSKLVHGGLRYLEQMEFGLVFEAVNERRILLDMAPHLVTPQPFLFPIYESSRRSRFVVGMGMWLYEALSMFRSPKRHRSLDAEQIEVEEPSLLADGLRGGCVYYDCATDDARLTLETLLDAVAAGAAVLTYAECVELLTEDAGVCGVRICNGLSGESFDVRAGAVLNATGPWTDRVRTTEKPLLRPTKGIHLVVEHRRLPVKFADVLLHPDDGRVMFAVPWGEHTYVGTTDTDFDGDPAAVRADGDDVRYVLRALAHYYPSLELGWDDVVSTWAGLRPLVAEDGVSESEVSREHEVLVDDHGLVTVAGGKLTTYRLMAEEVVDAVAGVLREQGRPSGEKKGQTQNRSLPGGVGWQDAGGEDGLVEELAARMGVDLDPAVLRALVRTYGTRASEVVQLVVDDPSLGELLEPNNLVIRAQVVWACTHELATTVADVLWRRLQLGLRLCDGGVSLCEQVAADMAAVLGWDLERCEREVECYRELVRGEQAWRDEREESTS